MQYLKTEGGGQYADLAVEVGVKAVLERMDKLAHADNGKFWDIEVKGYTNPQGLQYRGEEVAW
jgi:hypothetical protein